MNELKVIIFCFIFMGVGLLAVAGSIVGTGNGIIGIVLMGLLAIGNISIIRWGGQQ